MILDIFTLCDSVQSYGDKLVVVGATNTFAVNELPFILSNINIVTRLTFEKDEVQNASFKLVIYKPSDEILFCTEETGEMAIESKALLNNLCMNLTIHQLKLDEYGLYKMVFTANNQKFMTSFWVKPTASV